ncbi:MAG: hypothetical protein U0610_11490 [bacterium]
MNDVTKLALARALLAWIVEGKALEPIDVPAGATPERACPGRVDDPGGRARIDQVLQAAGATLRLPIAADGARVRHPSPLAAGDRRKLTRCYFAVDFVPESAELTTRARTIRIAATELESTFARHGFGPAMCPELRERHEQHDRRPGVGRFLYVTIAQLDEAPDRMTFRVVYRFGTRAGRQLTVAFEARDASLAPSVRVDWLS